MSFFGCLILPDETPPVRAYFHKAGFHSVYGRDGTAVTHGSNHLREVLAGLKQSAPENIHFSDFSYLLATLWGDETTNERMIDFFGYAGYHADTWPGNPDVAAWVMREGVYSPQRNITCGDTLMILGEEERYRRKTQSLEEYITNPPPLGIMNIRI